MITATESRATSTVSTFSIVVICGGYPQPTVNFMPMIDTIKEIKKASAAYGSSLSGRLGIALNFLCSFSMSYLHFPQKIDAEICDSCFRNDKKGHLCTLTYSPFAYYVCDCFMHS